MGVGLAVVAALTAAGSCPTRSARAMRHGPPGPRLADRRRRSARSRIVDGITHALGGARQGGPRGHPRARPPDEPAPLATRVVPASRTVALYAWELRRLRPLHPLGARPGHLRRGPGPLPARLDAHHGHRARRARRARPRRRRRPAARRGAPRARGAGSCSSTAWPSTTGRSPAVRAARTVRRVLPLLPELGGPPRLRGRPLQPRSRRRPMRRESSRLYWAPYRTGRAGRRARQPARQPRQPRHPLGQTRALPQPGCRRAWWGRPRPAGRRDGAPARGAPPRADGPHRGRPPVRPKAHPDIVASAIDYVINAGPRPFPVRGRNRHDAERRCLAGRRGRRRHRMRHDDANYNGGNGTTTACRQKATSNLIVNGGYAAVLALGDNQYNSGSLSAFQAVYDPTWGRFKSITHPAVGNHEYGTPERVRLLRLLTARRPATRARATTASTSAPGTSIALNSNCTRRRRLRRGLGSGTVAPQRPRRPPARRARSRSGHHAAVQLRATTATTRSCKPMWQDLYDANADARSVGTQPQLRAVRAPERERRPRQHARDPRSSSSAPAARSSPAWARPQPNSQVRNNDTFGVLKLTLRPTGYDWQFVPEAGPDLHRLRQHRLPLTCAVGRRA